MWEEVHPGNTAFWKSSRSTLTLLADRCTTEHPEYGDHTAPLLPMKGGSAAHLRTGLCEWGGRRQLMAGCSGSRTEVSVCCSQALTSRHLWRRHERRCLYVLTVSYGQMVTRSRHQPWSPHSSCPLSFTSQPNEDMIPLLRSSHVRVQHAPRVRGSISAKCLHSTTVLCITSRIKPFMHDCICATAVNLQFLAHFLFSFSLFLKSNFIRNSETKPIPWLV